MLEIKEKSDCCGCTSCYSICPQKAIKMVEDEEGFRYPVIDKKKCINCHLCEKVCPFIKSNLKINNDLNIIKAANVKNKDILLSSSSGGIFALLSYKVLKNNGVVIGATLNNNVLKHDIINNFDDIRKLQKSKYVQSNMNDIFNNVRDILNTNKEVLFVGTPCQVNGLKLFLRKEYNNLITCDFICHGVPSPKVFRDYMNVLGKNVDIDFRDKRESWKNYKISYKIDSKEKKNYYFDDPYMKGFLKNYYLRKSCYLCTSKGNNRTSDITLGDYWGIEKTDEIYNKRGNSLIIIHSKKGEKYINDISHDLNIKQIDSYDFNSYNASYNNSVKMPNERNEFFKYYNKNKNIINTFKAFNLYPSLKRKLLINLSKIKKYLKGRR